MTDLLATNTPELFDVAVKRAAELLRAGQLVALPTETVYGLAANALDAEAVARIFEAKGRPSTNPIIVHVASLEMARQCVARWPRLADQLARAFWPGPLTLVLERAAMIPDIVTAGGPTVGVRWPSHPFIQAVIHACGFPLAAPSANPSNEISPTTAHHVRHSLGRRIPLVVDGGPSHVGIESTVLDLMSTPPRLLRPGMIHADAIFAVLGVEQASCLLPKSTEPEAPGTGRPEVCPTRGGFAPPVANVLRSPGMLKRHYAPKARLLILQWRDEDDLKAQILQTGLASSMDGCHIIAHTSIPMPREFGRVAVVPREPLAFARAIYAELHQCDASGASVIVVEAPPECEPWRAIADRLARASAV